MGEPKMGEFKRENQKREIPKKGRSLVEERLFQPSNLRAIFQHIIHRRKSLMSSSCKAQGIQDTLTSPQKIKMSMSLFIIHAD